MSRLSNDLLGRTKRYASSTIRLFVSLPRQRDEVKVLGNQLLRSGTSVAAHAREANRARSDQEFVAKLGGLLQEADESCLWLELLDEDCHLGSPAVDELLKETNAIIAIFTTIIANIRRNQK